MSASLAASSRTRAAPRSVSHARSAARLLRTRSAQVRPWAWLLFACCYTC